ncbi:hypothetical protein MTBGP_11350 [Moorella thermoacetica]|uniref:hypothetical protein n=1 Tax=Neomoorella thermoacetica TaxID=1525 RepID=UPI0030D58FCD
MPKYHIRYGEQNKSGVFPFLGEIDYPYELKQNDVVILGEEMMKKVREDFPQIYSNQMWIASIHYFLPSENNQVTPPIIYITREEP